MATKETETRTGTPKLSVTWAPGAAAPKNVEEIAPVKRGGVEIDPFKGSVREAVVIDNHQLIKEAYELGVIDFETAIAALDKADRANRSAGKGILHDQRLKPATKAQKFMDYAMSIGMTKEEAQKRILDEVTASKKLAGRWGTVERETGLSLDEIRQAVARAKRHHDED